ncbi:MAG: methionyl-tRNA formyltransferase [Bacteroides sp.]|nr:methionyl-tRNA formyltransferase [Bacteroides sp.]
MNSENIQTSATAEKGSLRIVYMGTPEFAVEPLRCLVEGGYHVVGVVTMPDKPAGRGHKLRQSPVKEYAVQQGLPLLQPEKLKEESFLEQLRAWKADLQIVVAFRMLPEVVWNMPPKGTFNLHASLLPQYRGAAPINWAVIHGEKETGLTTFFLTHEIDTGEVIRQVRVPVAEEDNVGVVHDRLMKEGGPLVIETVEDILRATVKSVPQNQLPVEGELKPAPKLFKETCRIDWTRTTKQVYDFIRGLSPYPAAWTELVNGAGESIVVKIFESEKVTGETLRKPGTIQTDGKNFLHVATADGYVAVTSLQFPGKKRLTIQEVLRGYRIAPEAFMKTELLTI